MKRVNGKNKTKKALVSMVLIVLFLSITIGYSYLTRQLQINGLAEIPVNTWNVKWSRIKSETVGRKAKIVTPATITSSVEGKELSDVVNFSVKLDKPGDSYQLAVYRENEGSIDAILDSYNVTGLEGTENYLTFSIIDPEVTGDDLDDNGLGNLLQNAELPAETENYVIMTLKYEEDITEEDLLDEEAQLNVSVKLNYVQDLD